MFIGSNVYQSLVVNELEAELKKYNNELPSYILLIRWLFFIDRYKQLKNPPSKKVDL